MDNKIKDRDNKINEIKLFNNKIFWFIRLIIFIGFAFIVINRVSYSRKEALKQWLDENNDKKILISHIIYENFTISWIVLLYWIILILTIELFTRFFVWLISYKPNCPTYMNPLYQNQMRMKNFITEKDLLDKIPQIFMFVLSDFIVLFIFMIISVILIAPLIFLYINNLSESGFNSVSDIEYYYWINQYIMIVALLIIYIYIEGRMPKLY